MLWQLKPLLSKVGEILPSASEDLLFPPVGFKANRSLLEFFPGDASRLRSFVQG